MFSINLNKPIFLILIAILAGGSMAVYSISSANFGLKTAELIAFQQLGAIIIYLSCFGRDLFRR